MSFNVERYKLLGIFTCSDLRVGERGERERGGSECQEQIRRENKEPLGINLCPVPQASPLHLFSLSPSIPLEYMMIEKCIGTKI
jgi:hypothetical protein